MDCAAEHIRMRVGQTNALPVARHVISVELGIILPKCAGRLTTTRSQYTTNRVEAAGTPASRLITAKLTKSRIKMTVRVTVTNIHLPSVPLQVTVQYLMWK